jgi:1-acyl-sn-glycerol-3-phosphate acyltransferase
MLKNLRAFIRLILFSIVTILTVTFVTLGNIFFGISQRWKIKWKNLIIRTWARIAAAIIGIKMDVEGTPPKPPFFLVSNHLSYIDVIPLWRYTNATFVAKSEVKNWPFFGFGTRMLGVLFIDRELKRDVHRMNRRISSSITKEQGVILFPEGTSTKGAKVLPFKAPLLQYPAEIELPVSYATVSYKTGVSEWPAHLNVCWWGDMPFVSHFWNLLKMSGFAAKITFGDHEFIESDRKILADKLHKAVSDNFEPVIKEEHQQASATGKEHQTD